MKTLRIVFSELLWREKFTYAAVLVARIALVILDVIGIVLLGIAVSLVTGVSASDSSPTGQLLLMLKELGITNSYLAVSLIAVVFFFAKGFGSMALNNLGARRVSAIEYRHTSGNFKSLMSSDLATLEKWSLSELNQGLGYSSEMAYGKALMFGSIAFGEVALIAAILASLALISFPMFAILILYSFALAGVMSLAIGRRNKRLSKKLASNMLATNTLVQDAVSNFRQIKSAKAEAWFIRVFSAQRLALANSSTEMSALAVMPRYITEIALIVAVGGLVIARSLMGDAGLPVAVATVFVASIFRLVASLLSLQGSVIVLQQVDEAAKLSLRLGRAFNADGQKHDQAIAKQTPAREPHFLTARGVSYGYPNSPNLVLDNTDFFADEGDFIAITGVSGGGKSTFADLLLGLRKPSAGEISIGGLAPSEFLQNEGLGIGFVSQNATLLSATFSENITLEIGSTTFNQTRMDRALKLAQLEEVVSGLSQGLHTVIGGGAQGLSGGQVQRIALARALYREVPLLILDEATSALDSKTESAINNALSEMSSSTTIIVIAHRKSTIQAASKVWELRDGVFVRLS